jgi:hypothetical protein
MFTGKDPARSDIPRSEDVTHKVFSFKYLSFTNENSICNEERIFHLWPASQSRRRYFPALYLKRWEANVKCRTSVANARTLAEAKCWQRRAVRCQRLCETMCVITSYMGQINWGRCISHLYIFALHLWNYQICFYYFYRFLNSTMAEELHIISCWPTYILLYVNQKNL